ncbi:hypothetical protein H5410_059060 [Solanum commersonii]|uniref:Uncharacterized protein n=1 Tax=Solanum commersonii TaxID=4109 RepID=A0A9J5W2A9_SOLCO|nr:hypothetical protein H5410_059060 [Solanum commersonii]
MKKIVTTSSNSLVIFLILSLCLPSKSRNLNLNLYLSSTVNFEGRSNREIPNKLYPSPIPNPGYRQYSDATAHDRIRKKLEESKPGNFLKVRY